MQKEIPNLNGYFADTNGNIYGPRGLRCSEISRDGHLRISFNRGKKYFKRFVHQLILETFVGPCPEGMECRHLDGNPSNNTLENLVWGTQRENRDDAKRHGTLPFGNRQPRAKLIPQDIRLIIYCWKTKLLKQREIAKIFGISQRLVWNILHGLSWRHITNKLCFPV